MENKEITINQTLHGYNQGHELLASSVNLDSSSKRKMSYLSDLSGSDFSDEFDGYLEGYPLPNGDYVVSRTWKATEMRRPGCVWTHSLVLSPEMVDSLTSILDLNCFFKRPAITDSYSDYMKPIRSKLTHIDSGVFSGQSGLLTYSLISDPDKQVVLPTSSKLDAENNINSVWSMLPAESRMRLSFCCGYFSLTQPTKDTFQIVFIPKTTRRFSYDKKSVLFFENGQIPKNEEYKFFEDPDFAEILAFNYNTFGASKDAVLNAVNLLNVIRSDDPISELLNRNYQNLFAINSQFSLKVFGPTKSRFKSLEQIDDVKILEAILSRNYLYKNYELETNARLRELSAKDSVAILQGIISSQNEELKTFSYEIVDRLDISHLKYLNRIPAWLAVYLITSKPEIEADIFSRYDQRELNSIIYQTFQDQPERTLNFLGKNFNHHKIRKAAISLLVHSGDQSIDSLFHGIKINIDELTISEAVELYKYSSEKFFKYFNLSFLPESYIHHFLRHAPTDKHLDQLYEILTKQVETTSINGETALELINFTFRRNSKASNDLFAAIYPKVLSQLRGNSVLYEKMLQIRSLLPFGRQSSVIDNLEDLRQSLLSMASSQRVAVSDFLEIIDSKDELRDLCFSIHSLSKKDKKRLISALENHHGTDKEKVKIHYLLDSLE